MNPSPVKTEVFYAHATCTAWVGTKRVRIFPDATNVEVVGLPGETPDACADRLALQVLTTRAELLPDPEQALLQATVYLYATALDARYGEPIATGMADL